MLSGKHWEELDAVECILAVFVVIIGMGMAFFLAAASVLVLRYAFQ